MKTSRWLLPFTYGVDIRAIDYAVRLAGSAGATVVPVSLVSTPSKGARLEHIQQSKDFLEAVQHKAARHSVAIERYEVFTQDVLQSIEPQLAFNTAASFTTNTNWQNYTGEQTMSYLTQMAGLAFHQFVSAAAGIALAVALVRGLARRSAQHLGSFWVDLVRGTLYILLPICIV
ncbi:MAG: potassium-transporting ATPase subunit KdpA, partial [Ktedonobacteraceae bacterium]